MIPNVFNGHLFPPAHCKYARGERLIRRRKEIGKVKENLDTNPLYFNGAVYLRQETLRKPKSFHPLCWRKIRLLEEKDDEKYCYTTAKRGTAWTQLDP